MCAVVCGVFFEIVILSFYFYKIILDLRAFKGLEKQVLPQEKEVSPRSHIDNLSFRNQGSLANK